MIQTQRNWLVAAGLAALVMLILFVLLPADAWAQAMPWETPIQGIATSVTGPVAAAAFLIAVVILGITMIFGFSIYYMAIGVVIGGAIIANADTIASWMGF